MLSVIFYDYASQKGSRGHNLSLPTYSYTIVSFSHGVGCDISTYLPEVFKVATSHPPVCINNRVINIRPYMIC